MSICLNQAFPPGKTRYCHDEQRKEMHVKDPILQLAMRRLRDVVGMEGKAGQAR